MTSNDASGGELVLSDHLIPDQRTARNLAPLSPDLEPEVRVFSETMRSLYGTLDVSLTRFAAQVHCDKGTLSRYLSGRSLPASDFVEKLLEAFFDKKGRPVTGELQDLVNEQHLAALRAGSPARYRVQDLSNRLRIAIEQKQQCEIEIAVLSEAMHSRQKEIYRLEMETREIRAAWSSEREAAETESEKDRLQQLELQEAIEKLQQEVVRLNNRLHAAQRRARAAERRCQQLEEELEAASVMAEEQSAEELAQMREQLRASEELLAQTSQRFAIVKCGLDAAKAEVATLTGRSTEVEGLRAELARHFRREQELSQQLEQARQRAASLAAGKLVRTAVAVILMTGDR